MTDITNQKLGGTGIDLGTSYHPVPTFYKEIDIAAAIADGLVADDTIAVMTIPANAPVLYFNAAISEALTAGTTTNIGTTYADPDEFIDAQTTVAVGQFGAVAATTLAASTSERTLYAKIGGTPAAGKIKIAVTTVLPAAATPAVAKPRSYPN